MAATPLRINCLAGGQWPVVLGMCMSLGDELHKLFLECDGDFRAVEAEIVKFNRSQKEEWLRGGWHTEVSLLQLGWTELLDYILYTTNPT